MKKGSKEWKAMEKTLRMEALVLQQRSMLLRERSVKLCEDIEDYSKKYPEDVRDNLPWDEKEAVEARIDELESEWKETRRILIGLENEFQDLCKRTNKFYGHEVIPPYDALAIPEENPEEKETDSADWWKHSE